MFVGEPPVGLWRWRTGFRISSQVQGLPRGFRGSYSSRLMLAEGFGRTQQSQDPRSLIRFGDCGEDKINSVTTFGLLNRNKGLKFFELQII